MPLAFDITFTVLYKCSGRVTTRFLKNNTRFLHRRKRKIFLVIISNDKTCVTLMSNGERN